MARTIEEVDKEIAETKEAIANVKGEECEVYARIVGYYRNVNNWNKGKRDEFNKRKMFDEPEVKKECECEGTCENCTCHESPNTELLDDDITRATIFIKDNCPNCPSVKAYMEGVHIEKDVFNCSESNGLDMAARYGVITCPTVIFYNFQGKEIVRCHNTQELEEVMNNYRRVSAVE